MRPSESAYPADWLDAADRDLDRVTRSLRDADVEAAAFFLQQAVEKYLKTFLLAKGTRLRRVHDLEALLDDAVAFDASLESFRSLCQTASEYYIPVR